MPYLGPNLIEDCTDLFKMSGLPEDHHKREGGVIQIYYSDILFAADYVSIFQTYPKVLV